MLLCNRFKIGKERVYKISSINTIGRFAHQSKMATLTQIRSKMEELQLDILN